MKSAPLHPNEAERLRALVRYDILDSDSEAIFDELTQLASTVCGTNISLISLVDSDRQWFKSRVGLDATETPREIAFCSHAILQKDVFEVPNATEDARFFDNPLVTSDPNIKFYAGAPLTTSDGHSLGTLCVIDSKPKTLNPEQISALKVLSHQVISQLELRAQTRRMERIDMIREKLLSVIAHDLKSPFTSIMGFSKILSKRADKLSPSEIASMSQSILSSSTNAYQLLDELLQWYQHQLGTFSCQLTDQTILPIADDCISNLQPIAKNKDIKFTLGIDSSLQAQMDATLTKTILRNLISNAIKYSPSGGTISVKAQQNYNHILVSVEDNGDGVPLNKQDNLFKSPVESAIGTDGEIGHGIGLSLCEDFIRMQGGEIWLDKDFQNGTKIVFKLNQKQTH